MNRACEPAHCVLHTILTPESPYKAPVLPDNLTACIPIWSAAAYNKTSLQSALQILQNVHPAEPAPH